ncbi:TM0106 family RecB-like putative nuclease [Rhodococcus spelaei]|uniref:TM0106 family RecB-like putative nuclease n=1 Tax=Rhodococcus spelaei TaxID=2546320 RepID=A0A541AZV4_9NOCA|nr:bifunctional RecB family nuclease/DEAD/DEAH box helicase [Rhodococcus spelaei]TQF65586.1 TM0106 family RecB-like putative nuclease [Rhodococcus spelaei]
MFLLDDVLIYSASDLSQAAECEYALLRRLDAKLGLVESAGDDEPDPMLDRTSALGDDHERLHLQRFRDRFGDGVVQIERPRHDWEELTRANRATVAAARSGADAIFQGTFFDGRFLGFCDFLVREDGRYSVYDTKLSRHAKVTALLQLAAYADALTADGIAAAPLAHLILGDHSEVSYPLEDIAPVYRQRRTELLRVLDEHRDEAIPAQWGDPRYRACGRCGHCGPEVERTRDLLLVAGMRTSQREKLIRGGIADLDALADSQAPVDGMSKATFAGLRAQAAAQVRQERGGTPVFEVIDDAGALAAIPTPDAGDIFFDFEGDPLWAEDGSSDWGLEYLFGVVEADTGEFRPFWAHDRAQERRALIDFLDYVAERRKLFPGMHVYHYAAYEKTALLRLAGRYGVGEDAVDTLLRESVLVDLYPVVRAAIRVGARSYSIKKLEPLYMGEQLRGGDVTDAAASIVAYADYCGLRDAGKVEQAQELLDGIADYNEYDCVSTHRLRDWLLGLAGERGVSPHPVQPVLVSVTEDPDPAELALRGYVGDTLPVDRSADRQAAALMAAAVGYHRRERKPFWWAHFDRLVQPEDEWADAADVLVAERVEVIEDWHRKTARQNLRRRLRISGRWGTGSTPREGDVHILYDKGAGVGTEDPATRGAVGAKVIELAEEVAPGGEMRDVVIVEEVLRRGAEEHVCLPMAVAPGPPIRTNRIEAAIAAQAAEMAATLPAMPSTAAVDILRRVPPRTRSGSPLPIADPENRAAAITAALLDLDNSYLAVQGPPGTGKTHTGAAVVADLVVRHGWRVGVVAQSHSVVENMLDGIVRAGVPGERVAKKPGSGLAEHPAWTKIEADGLAGFLADHEQSGCVIGGTAWDLAHTDRVPAASLDLLVVDEAGQFALANTVAVGISARNLLLLGDPQQLPQVSQGTHPEPVDTSALGWLAEGHGALPAELGYFLDRTWRMHPAVCEAVSTLSYDGQLKSQESVTTARALTGVEPGVTALYVEHDGNSTESAQEASAILAEVQALLGRDWTDPQAFDGTRPLGQPDILVVAPYNAQVGLLRRTLADAGLGEVLVGTVDKFQGREAAVVLMSMTASSIDDVPRGMGFLLSRNRLNVAVSRGKWRAVIVRAPMLTHYLPSTPAGLAELGAFMRMHG